MPTVLTLPNSHTSKNGEPPRRPMPTLFRTFEASVYCASSILVIPIGGSSSTAAYLKPSEVETETGPYLRMPVVKKAEMGSSEGEEAEDEGGSCKSRLAVFLTEANALFS